MKSLKKVNILAGPKLFFVSQPSWSTTFATRSFSGQGSYIFVSFVKMKSGISGNRSYMT